MLIAFMLIKEKECTLCYNINSRSSTQEFYFIQCKPLKNVVPIIDIQRMYHVCKPLKNVVPIVDIQRMNHMC